jgi:CBS domain-containing protein
VRQYIDFLGGQAPFDTLGPADLERLARHVEVEYAPAGTEIVAAGQPPLDHIYVIRKGAVDVVDRGHVVDQLGPGDVFGHLSVLSGLPPPLAVHATEDTLLYRLPDPRPLVADPKLLHFRHYASLATRAGIVGGSGLDTGQRPVRRYLRPPVWAEPGDTAAAAAAKITAAGQSCALVRTPQGLGIVTDSDFRRASGRAMAPESTPAAALATVPARIIAARTTRAQALVIMVEHGVHHLVVVGPDGQPTGIVRALDLGSADVRDPLLIRRAIEGAASLGQLTEAAARLPATAVELADSGLPGPRVGQLLTAIRDALLRKIIELSGAPDGPDWSWFVLGSTARHEPLPGSDLDTAVAWPDPPADPEPTASRNRSAAEQVLRRLERCGLRRCPDGANASNPQFSRSVSGWAEAAAVWRHSPEGDRALLLTSMVADSRAITNLAVGRLVTEQTRPHQPGHEFLALMLRLALAVRPPIGFVRDFVVDHSGEHRGQLDLKRRGLRPVAAIGRWVAVVTGDVGGSTLDRLDRGRAAGLLTADETDSLRGAFELIYELLLHRHVEAIRAGQVPSQHIDPQTLDPLHRRYLRSAFREISQVQADLENDWVRRLP